MRGISEDELINIADQLCTNERLIIYDRIVAECRELQESWMTLEEFLKNPKYEWHWIVLVNKQIHMVYVSYNDSENYVFYLNDFDRDESYSLNEITHVMPIHKPEPPR